MTKILIVDDDDELRSNMSTVLNEFGYSVDTASSGAEAIAMSSANKYGIILLDLMMPVMNGMDVLVELKLQSPRTKVIIVTAFASIETTVEAMKKGACDYIAKPFKSDDLDLIIKKSLEEARFDLAFKNLHLDDALGSLSNPIRRNIITILAVYKEMRLMEITRQLEIEDHTKISFHLRILKESRIIDQNGRSYFLTNEGKRIYDSLRYLEENIST